MENKELKINAEKALKAYKSADSNGRLILEQLFGEELFNPKNIMDRVKTFEDAMNELGSEHTLVTLYESFMKDIPEKDDFDNDVASYLKLRIVVAALNEGWEPQFTEDEYRWYPYFYLYTKEEYNRLNEDEKKKCRVVGRSSIYASVYGGVAYAHANYAWSHSSTGSGCRLALKSEELAEYCGKQFIDIWMDYLIA